MAVTKTETGVRITHPSNPQTSAEILAFGATVTSWQIAGKDQLWLSSTSKLDGSKAVRGGIPLVFPRFGPASGNHPATDKLPQHGFARSVAWELLGQVDETTVEFGLGPEQLTPEFRAAWPYDFTLKYTVGLAEDALHLTLSVENPGKEAFDFNVLFHTYFAVPDVAKVTVAGLSGRKFWNKVAAQNDTDGEAEITFTAETDRVYAGAPAQQTIKAAGKPLYETATKNLRDVVVWNPWAAGAKGMSDFDDEGYHHMVCVENGSVAEFVPLKAGSSWEGAVTLKARI